MYDQSEVPPHFARSLAVMEEVRAQYSADHERAIADDEARQAAFAKLLEEHRAQDAQSQADREAALAAAAEGTAEDPAASEQAERTAQRVAKQVAEDDAAAAMFRVEDDTEPAEPAPPAVPPPPASAARHRAWEDDDFSATNWIDAE